MAKRIVSHPHDTLARHFLTSEDLTADLLRNYVDSDLVDFLDLDNLKCEATADVDETLSEYIGDLRFSTTFKNSKRRSEVFVFFEHQSKKDRLIGFRLLRYIVNAYEKMLESCDGGRLEEFPYPVAVVLYHGKTRWADMPRMPDLLAKMPGVDPDVLKFPLFLIDLAAMPEESIHGLPALRALLKALQAASAGTLPERIDSITETLVEAKGDKRARIWMSALLRYASTQLKFRNIKEFYIHSFGKIFGKKEAEAMAMTSADELMLEGLKRGRMEGKAEGKAEGRTEGKAEAIITVLESRFGPLSARVKKAVSSQTNWVVLDSLTALAATCKSLDEFKRGLKK